MARPLTVLAATLLAASAYAQVNVIVPQTVRPTVIQPRPNAPVQLQAVNVDVVVTGQAARTLLELTLYNPSPRPQEAQLLVPVPDGAAVSSLQYDGTGPEPTATILPRREARRIYSDIVRKMQDPALIEFAGLGLIKTSVFPVPANTKQTVRLTYEQLLPNDAGRIDYVLPRTQSLEHTGVTWSMRVEVKAGHPVSTIYSPTHELKIERVGDGHLIATAKSANQPGPFRFSVLLARENAGVNATFLAYPDPAIAGGYKGGGGYFMMLVGLPPLSKDQTSQIKREVILVIDRSGSMRGQKIEQAREAALQVIEALDDGEAFNIIDYSDTIEALADKPLLKSAETIALARRYLASIKATGGTNIHDALIEAMHMPPTPGDLPMVLFLTDGLPTVGVRNEAKIRDAAQLVNIHQRRIFTFGVGYDVNAPLLSALARDSRASATFVLPDEDVEVKVASVFRKLSGPVLASPDLAYALDDPTLVPGKPVREMMPRALPDLFDGDQLVVLGQYMADAPISFTLTGNFLGQAKTFNFTFDTNEATTRNAYVPRLWASRKIASLIEQIRRAGGDGQLQTTATQPDDPRFKELVDEIVRLSTEFGILTEYTAFLATEPEQRIRLGLTSEDEERAMLPGMTRSGRGAAPAVRQRLMDRAEGKRAGVGGVVQEKNLHAQLGQTVLNKANAFELDVGDTIKKISIDTVRQIDDQTFYQRGDRWIDARLLDKQDKDPDETIVFGTDEYDTLIDTLIARNQQGLLALKGRILLLIDGKQVLIIGPGVGS